MGETRSMTGFQRTKEYQRFGQPDNADDWIQDRIYLREKLVEKGIEQLYTDAQIDQLRQRADKLYQSSTL